MDKVLYHTVSITLPYKIEEKVRAVRDQIVNRFSDQYNYLAAGAVWGAHVGMFTLCINRKQGETMLAKAKEMAKIIQPFNLSLGKIELSNDQKYIFLNFDEKSEVFLKDLNRKFFKKLDLIRDGAIPPKFLNHWDELSEREKMLLVKTGNKYPFVPHFSLAKLHPEESQKAIEEIDVHQFENVHFTVAEFNFTRQDANKENEFPQIATIPLSTQR